MRVEGVGCHIWNGSEKKTADNYERIINNINFMINQNCRRNLNLVRKVWVSNTFILAKLWYISQIMPPENPHFGKIKKGYWKYTKITQERAGGIYECR
jgi:hypothetical protein